MSPGGDSGTLPPETTLQTTVLHCFPKSIHVHSLTPSLPHSSSFSMRVTESRQAMCQSIGSPSASRLTRWACREHVCTEGGLLLQIPSPCPLHPAWFPSVTLCRLPGFWPLSLGRAKASGRGLGEFSSLILSPSFEERERGPSPEGIDQKTSGPPWPT